MAIQPMPSASEFLITYMDLDNEEKNTITTCIRNYSAPKNFSDTISWLVFRITNAFKHLFKNSDWDRATNLIQEKLIAFTNRYPNLNQHHDEVSNTTHLMSNKLLSLCFLAYEHNTEDTPAFRAHVAPLHPYSIVVQLNGRINAAING